MVNDTIMLRDQAHTDYPIAYRIAEQCTLTAAGIEGVIKNPIQSRLFVTAVAQQFDGALYSKGAARPAQCSFSPRPPSSRDWWPPRRPHGPVRL